MNTLFIDIETFSSVNLLTCGVYKYVESPDFEILIFAYSIDGGPVQVVELAKGEKLPKVIESALSNPDVKKYAYNAAFEWCCLRKFYNTDIAQWECTMVHALYCGLPTALAAVGAALNLEDKKSAAGKKLINLFSVPVKPTKKNGQKTRIRPEDEPSKWAEFVEYCRQDVAAEMAIHDKLKSFPVPSLEWVNWHIAEAVNLNGVLLDLGLVSRAIDCDTKHTEALSKEAMGLTGIDNPNSRNQMLSWLSTECGQTVDSLTKDAVTKMLGDGGLSTDVERALQLRQELSKTSIAKYSAMERVVCRDGRIRGMFSFYGANRTGRFSGRLVQLQNMPRNYIEPLGLARELVRSGDLETIKLVYASVPNVLSQLTRTAFIPSKGCKYVVADSSAIEARVLAWLANEKWVMGVFAGDGKIYEACASNMFGVPIETIVKGGANYELRAKGKVATLACGYGGSVGALQAMGAGDVMSDSEMQDVVTKWRAANPSIVSFWYKCENAALLAIKTGGASTVNGITFRREIDFENRLDFLTMELPSKRKLFYAFPSVGVNRWGGESIMYMGQNQTSRKWSVLETYSGKLAENCIAFGTPILTDKGWVEIQNVSLDMRVWDGVDWVDHGGVVCKGEQEVIEAHGVLLTPEHRILTDKGWVCASQSEGFNRAKVQLPDGHKVQGQRREKLSLGSSMRLWGNKNYSSQRIFKKENKILRLYAKGTNRKRKQKTWPCKTRYIWSVAKYGRPLSATNTSGLAQLWRKGYKSLSRVGGFGIGFLAGHERGVQKRVNTRPHRQRFRVLQRELPLGYYAGASEQQTLKHLSGIEIRHDHSCGTKPAVGHWKYNATLPDSSRMPKRETYRHTGFHKQVFDILDCGPRHRFIVLGRVGPVIVHNCTQAVARDCLTLAMRKLNVLRYNIVMHIHDEIVIECAENEAESVLETVCAVMGEPIPWASGLLLKADGFISDYYKKEG